MTLKEVDILFEAHYLKRDEEYNLATFQAWHTAAFSNMKKMPALSKVLKKRKLPPKKQSLQQQKQFALEMTRKLSNAPNS